MFYALLFILWLVNSFFASKLIASAVAALFTSVAGLFYRVNKRPERGAKEAGQAAGELVAETGGALVVAGVLGVVMTFVEVLVFEGGW